MNTYMFTTVTTMKEYNNKKWWIDGDIIRTKYIEANTVNEALKKYQEIVENDNYISISNNALKNKAPMYVDTKDGDCKQVGYVITGKLIFRLIRANGQVNMLIYG